MPATRRATKRQTVDDLEAQIAALQAKRDELQRRNREAMGLLCERAGLLNINVAPEELEAALKEVAGRFRKHEVAAVDPGAPSQSPAAGAA